MSTKSEKYLTSIWHLRNAEDHIAMLQHQPLSRILMERTHNDTKLTPQLGIVYYEVLKPQVTITGTIDKIDNIQSSTQEKNYSPA